MLAKPAGEVRCGPILFSGPMVRAILAGDKTQTRRMVRLRAGQEIEHGAVFCASDPFRMVVSPYGAPGDRLWVRETWYDDNALRGSAAAPTAPDRYLEYRADHDCRNWEAGCPCRDENGRSSWRPSIHMPRWASRITLEVTEVRVHRLQDISEEDARAEGVNGSEAATARQDTVDVYGMAPHRAAFAAAWEAINGKRAPWSSNDWVWAISFRRVEP